MMIDKDEAIKDLKRLEGLPPFDGFNPCAGDNYFAQSLVNKYGMSIGELSKQVGFNEIYQKFRNALKGI